MWRFATGKLRRTYDESADAASELQRAGPESLRLEPIDFGRRQALEKELTAESSAAESPVGLAPNAIFDESGNYMLYGTLLGIKVRRVPGIGKFCMCVRVWYELGHSHVELWLC